jgi:hypothetical protein
MTNNLHISYDLNKPGQDYSTLIAKIKTLGGWAKIHKSYWYVNSSYTAEQVVNFLWQFMDKSDSIYVVDATNKNSAWRNISTEAATYIKSNWNQKAPVS